MLLRVVAGGLAVAMLGLAGQTADGHEELIGGSLDLNAQSFASGRLSHPAFGTSEQRWMRVGEGANQSRRGQSSKDFAAFSRPAQLLDEPPLFLRHSFDGLHDFDGPLVLRWDLSRLLMKAAGDERFSYYGIPTKGDQLCEILADTAEEHVAAVACHDWPSQGLTWTMAGDSRSVWLYGLVNDLISRVYIMPDSGHRIDAETGDNAFFVQADNDEFCFRTEILLRALFKDGHSEELTLPAAELPEASCE